MSGFLNGTSGERSSKRLAGFIGVAVMAAISALALWREPNSAVDLVNTWAIFSGGCLGLGVVEKFSGREAVQRKGDN